MQVLWRSSFLTTCSGEFQLFVPHTFINAVGADDAMKSIAPIQGLVRC